MKRIALAILFFVLLFKGLVFGVWGWEVILFNLTSKNEKGEVLD